MARRSSEMSGIFDWLKPKPKPQPSAPSPRVNVDLYAVLGVPANASQEDIKRAFRELAMKFHPDRNPNDPVAEKKYTEISTAYAILGDETQRAAYDRMRPPPEVPRGHGGMIPRGTRAPEEKIEPPKRQIIAKVIDKAIIEQMFGVQIKKPKGAEKELTFDFLAPGPPNQPPARIPVPTSAFAAFDPASKRIPMMPAIDVPDDTELWHLVQTWRLDEWAWDIVREARQTQEFQRAGAIALDVIAGAGANTPEADIADVFRLSKYQAEQVVNTKGREAYYVNVIYPIFDRVISILDQIKPPDLPGRFFLDWDPTGKVIEFFYAENIGGRR